MEKCLALAKEALLHQEIPVGALLVDENDKIIAQSYNLRETQKSATAHAELLVIQDACKTLERWRLQGCTLYVTLEPCFMCAGAIVLARIPRVVFATHDPKAGAVGSLANILEDKRLNHRCKVTSGVCAAEAASLLKDFFKMRRKKSPNPIV